MIMPSTLPEFNPSQNPHVDKIKSMTEELMKYLLENVPDNHCRSFAITNYERAAMWAMRANFT